MRELKFRGKRIDNGEWIYGCLTRYSDHMSYIVVDVTENNGTYQVLTETVGQYTGLKDRNRREIYEGDIIYHKWHNGYEQIAETVSEVKWRKGAFVVDDKKRADWLLSIHSLAEHWASVEVIGNIYENPELLKGEETS